ncbi:MAG: phosphoribosylglycinamide formyltransferase [Lachnospiraceae bacterium]|nr:phosphoribosylglycinamide formyltransferase [Bacillota bacterium]MDO5592031.1 phosphoribosylglycinamide formyltransferase [Bacillota bacterium]MDY2949735.1 phosphoribosylglycinamide formyltransferase [Lachnospiraceae bacterium]
MLKLTVLVSGGGTNLQAIIDRIADGSIHGAEIVRVISNNPGVYALERAEKAGIPSQVLSPKDFASREEFNDALLAALQASGADLVVLAGCLVAIPPQVVKAYPNRIINIHPALIPSFCGKGFYGLHVHEKVLERGVKVTGATVHFVDEDLDHGKILLQKAVEIPDGITPKELQQKVMKEAEWIILPKAIDMIADGQIPIGE